MNVGTGWERGQAFLGIHISDFRHTVLHSTAIHDRVLIEFSSPKNLSSLSVAGSVLPALAGEWDNFSKGDIKIRASLYDINSRSYFSQKLFRVLFTDTADLNNNYYGYFLLEHSRDNLLHIWLGLKLKTIDKYIIFKGPTMWSAVPESAELEWGFLHLLHIGMEYIRCKENWKGLHQRLFNYTDTKALVRFPLK